MSGREASSVGDERGFTIIEMMIVMVILGILAGVVLFAVGVFNARAEDSKSAANCEQHTIAVAAQKASVQNSTTLPILAFFEGETPTC